MTYILKEEVVLHDVDAIGYLYEHEKSKAQVCFIKNEDDNKSFSITFKTPTYNDTGLPHILEHSVLCGSKKYNIKDPFIELAKGSLNTFLNAMTFADKTMYPIASVNDKDFHNLTDVYLDAVFHPNIYRNPNILKQEGWHYHLEDEQDTIEYKGVVFNEMKGAFSSPDQLLHRSIRKALFENHPYTYDSGGVPSAITDLSEEEFLAYHKKYYHPSNSYILYYGNVNIEEELNYLEENYLNEYEAKERKNEIPLAKRFEEVRKVESYYPVVSEEGMENKAYLSYNVLLSTTEDVVESYGLEIMEYLLGDAPGAVIKEALIKAGICEDVSISYDNSIQEGIFSIIGKNCNPDNESKFVEIIEDVFRKYAKEGFPEDKLDAAINIFEFRAKEADFGSYPKGVIYSISALETWLYGYSPFGKFEYSKIYKELREKCSKGYLQELICRYFLENTHQVHFTMLPDTTLNERKVAEEKEKVRAYETSLTKKQRQDVIEETKKVIQFGQDPIRKEELETLPLLSLEDIDRNKAAFEQEDIMIDDAKVLYHPSNASNIVYHKIAFDISHLDEKELVIASLLSRFLRKVNTQNYTYAELSDEINGKTGGIITGLNVYDHKESVRYFSTQFEITSKSFIENQSEMNRLIKEIIVHTKFDDVTRIKELLNETKARLHMALPASGHTTAILRSSSRLSKASASKEYIKGVSFYEEVNSWTKRSDEDIKELGMLMEKMLLRIVSNASVTVGVTCSLEYKEKALHQVKNLMKTLPRKEQEVERVDIPLIEKHTEGIKTASDVQYVAMSFDIKAHGFEYTGSLRVTSSIIGLNYLWNNVRVKNGAYGAFGSIGRNGLGYFASYRDPNIKETIEIYKKTSDFIEALALDERELTKYIIGVMSSVDHPLTPSMENEKMMTRYFSQITDEEVQKEREEILDTTIEDIKNHYEMYQKIFLKENLVVVGSSQKVKENEDLFEIITDFA